MPAETGTILDTHLPLHHRGQAEPTDGHRGHPASPPPLSSVSHACRARVTRLSIGVAAPEGRSVLGRSWLYQQVRSAISLRDLTPPDPARRLGVDLEQRQNGPAQRGHRHPRWLLASRSPRTQSHSFSGVAYERIPMRVPMLGRRIHITACPRAMLARLGTRRLPTNSDQPMDHGTAPAPGYTGALLIL